MDISPLVEKFYKEITITLEVSPFQIKKVFNPDGKIKITVENEVKSKLVLSKILFYADLNYYYIVNQKTKKLLFVGGLFGQDPRTAIRTDILDRPKYMNVMLLTSNNSLIQVKELLNTIEEVNVFKTQIPKGNKKA